MSDEAPPALQVAILVACFAVVSGGMVLVDWLEACLDRWTGGTTPKEGTDGER